MRCAAPPRASPALSSRARGPAPECLAVAPPDAPAAHCAAGDPPSPSSAEGCAERAPRASPPFSSARWGAWPSPPWSMSPWEASAPPASCPGSTPTNPPRAADSLTKCALPAPACASSASAGRGSSLLRRSPPARATAGCGAVPFESAVAPRRVSDADGTGSLRRPTTGWTVPRGGDPALPLAPTRTDGPSCTTVPTSRSTSDCARPRVAAGVGGVLQAAAVVLLIMAVSSTGRTSAGKDVVAAADPSRAPPRPRALRCKETGASMPSTGSGTMAPVRSRAARPRSCALSSGRLRMKARGCQRTSPPTASAPKARRRRHAHVTPRPITG
mmetsp:Transcript_16155/g.49389  ORF Transcript_16155/g.49389 Transcript_16155/m.49389 type:complete len:329 (-) Transcript_16155:72-1058(-)